MAQFNPSPLVHVQVERMLPVGTVLTAVGELNTAVDHPSAFQVDALCLLPSLLHCCCC